MRLRMQLLRTLRVRQAYTPRKADEQFRLQRAPGVVEIPRAPWFPRGVFQQRGHGRDASAHDADAALDGGPEQDARVIPGGIARAVGLEGVVDADAFDDADEEADGEGDEDAGFLRALHLQAPEPDDGEAEDEEVGDQVRDEGDGDVDVLGHAPAA